MMSLLAPLFLLGVAAIALPFWLHRLQTESSDRRPFSSAMLLERAEQRVHVQKKLKYLLLLALRVLLLLLLALAFAQPFLRLPADVVEATDAGTHLVLVDTSASMARVGTFSQARETVRDALDRAPADALLQLATVDRTFRVVGELGNDRSRLLADAASLDPSRARLDYGAGMTAVERFVAALPPPVTLHFVSDFQASGMPVRFADLVPAGVERFVPHVVGTGEPFNWYAEYARDSAAGIQFGINGAGDRERLGDAELYLNGSLIATHGLSQTGPQVLDFARPEYEPGENRVELRIVADDDFAADNRWFHVVDNKPPTPTPLITLDTGGLPMTYLSAALESAAEYRVEPLIAGNFDPRILSRYRWAVVDDIGLLDGGLDAALSDYLSVGGNLLVFAGERAAGLEMLPLAGNRRGASGLGLPPGEFLSIGRIESTHPALARSEGWQSVSVSRYLPLLPEAGDRVLIALQNGDPFLIERQVGQGRLLLVAAHLDNRWSDLPARPVFVSFVIEAARYLAGINEIDRTYLAGSSLPLAVAGYTSGQVVDPEGNTLLSLADTTREQQINLDIPGFYEVYTPQGQTVVAANIDPRESDLTRIGQDVLDRWQDATASQPAVTSAAFSMEQERSLELWHWLLLLLAVVVIGESILGNMHLKPRVERA